MATIAELVVEVGADIKGALGGLQQLDNRLQQAGSRAGQLATSLAPVGAALTAVGVVGLRAYSDYEQALSDLIARTGLYGEELQQVEQLAQQVGSTTMYSSTQAVQAMTELVASGSSVEEAMQLLDDVLNLAAAGGLDLGHSADALTDVMEMFGLGAEHATQVVNALTAAEGASSATVDDLVQSLQNAGPVARAYGMDINQTAAALAVLAEQGLKGPEAGTALKSMLLNMTRPTEEVREAWEALGTSFYDAQGQARPLPDILNDIKAGLADKTTEEANALLHDLAGSYGLVALNALLGGQSLDEMQAVMGEQRTAAEIAAARMDTLGGAVHQLRASLQQLMINVMRPFVTRYLRPAIAAVTEMVRAIMGWLAQHPEVTEALGVIGGGVVALTAALGGASIALSVLGGALGALSLPLVAVAVAIGAAVYAIKNDLLGLGGAFEAVVSRISQIAERVMAAFQEGGLSNAGRVLLGELLAGLGDVVAWTREHITDPVIEALRTTDWGAVANRLGEILERFLGWAGAGVASAGAWLWEHLISPAIGYLSNVNLAGLGNRLLDLLVRLWGWEFSLYTSVGAWLWEHLISPAISYLSNVDLAGLGNRLLDLLVRFIGWEFSLYTNAGLWLWEKIIQPIVGYLGSVNWATVGNTLLALLEQFLGAAAAGLASVGDWVFQNLIQPIVDMLLNSVGAVADAAKKLGEGLYNAVLEAIKGLPAAIAKVIDSAIPNKIDLGITSVDLPDNPVADLLGAIPAMATGGVVTRPTLALVGERGPEAVVPLSRLGAGVGRTVTISGPVYVYGVHDPARLLDALEREAGRRGMRLTYAAGRA